MSTTRGVDPRSGAPAHVTFHIKQVEWAAFINDDWKATRTLTLNLGLRYENFGTWQDSRGRLRGIVFGPGSDYIQRLASARVDMVKEFYPTDKLNFAPRLGFAWDVGGKGRTTVRGGFGIAYDRPFQLPAQRYERNPPLFATVQLGYFFGTQFQYSLGDASKPYWGYPVDAALQTGLDSRNGVKGARVEVHTIDPNVRSPYTYNWFLGVQRQLASNLVVEFSYLGSAAHHLFNVRDVNRVTGDLMDGRFDGINPSFSSIYSMESTSNSSYHGGTVSLRRRFHSGLSLQSNFTYGKSISDTDNAVNYVVWQNTWDRRAERALTSYDAPRRLSAVAVWETPFLRGRKSRAARMLSGWQLSGFLILQSGLPMNPIMNAAWPRGDFNADNTVGDRPNAPLAGTKTSGWSRSDFLSGALKPADFPIPTPGTNGNLGRDTLRGPGFAWADVSFSKSFVVSERIRAQLRLDAFNALNRVNLNNPVMDMNNTANFGKSTSSLAPRACQIGLRLDFGPGSGGGAAAGGRQAPGQKNKPVGR